jgi:hypothetical protein
LIEAIDANESSPQATVWFDAGHGTPAVRRVWRRRTGTAGVD